MFRRVENVACTMEPSGNHAYNEAYSSHHERQNNKLVAIRFSPPSGVHLSN
jgi:hypothetical protein